MTISAMTPCDTLFMSAAKPEQDEPGHWTEEAYLALGETKHKIELIDGGLWVSPSASNPHNEMLINLAHALKGAAGKAGFRTLVVSTLQLDHERFVIPDIAVGRFDRNTSKNTTTETKHNKKNTTPDNTNNDHTTKKTVY